MKGYSTQNIMIAIDFNLCFTFIAPGWESTSHDLIDNANTFGYMVSCLRVRYNLSEFQKVKGTIILKNYLIIDIYRKNDLISSITSLNIKFHHQV